MRLRYKSSGVETAGSTFNMSALAEVLTGDDTVFIKDLDVYLEALQDWKDMRQAFKDHDLIVDNHNERFFEPKTEEDRERGYTTR